MKILCAICNEELEVIEETPSSILLEHDCKRYNEIMQQRRVVEIRIIKGE